MDVLFVDALVIDGRGGIAERGRVLVREGRIAAIGRDVPLPKGDGTSVVDLGGRILMPGLIDTHVHVAGGDYFPGYEDEAIGVAALRTAEVALRTLMAGVTTIRTAGSRDYLDLQIRDAIDQRLISGPRILAAGRGLTITGGHLAGICLEVDGPDEMRKAVREHVKRGADAIKLMMSAGVATAGLDIQATQFGPDEVAVAVYEAHKAGRRVLTHAIGREAIRTAIAGGVDSIDHGHYLDEESAVRMKERGTYLVPTFGPGYYYTEVRQAEPWRIARAEAVKEQHVRAFRLALDVGVPIAMGCDCGAPSRMPNGENALELELMVRHGMSPEQAIRAATVDAATLVGLADRLGTVEVGKIADLIALDRNPLEDIRACRTGVRLVMRSGAVVRDDDGLAGRVPGENYGKGAT